MYRPSCWHVTLVFLLIQSLLHTAPQISFQQNSSLPSLSDAPSTSLTSPFLHPSPDSAIYLLLLRVLSAFVWPLYIAGYLCKLGRHHGHVCSCVRLSADTLAAGFHFRYISHCRHVWCTCPWEYQQAATQLAKCNTSRMIITIICHCYHGPVHSQWKPPM